MTLKATEAAFEGFRLTRREPWTIAWWSGVYLVLLAVVFLAAGPSIAGLMAAMQAMQSPGGEGPDPADMQAIGAAYAGLAPVVLPLSVIVSAILNAAVARSVLRPAERRFGYMRLGMDEVRVFGVTVVVGLVVGGAALLAGLVIGVIAGLASALGQPALLILAILVGLAGGAALIWLALRLSLAVPIAIAERTFRPLASWTLTRGVALPVLGVALLAFVMTMLVSLLASVISMPLTLVTGGIEALAQFEGRPIGEILSAAAPAIILFCISNAVFSALQLAVLYAPFSAVYADLKGLPRD